MNSLLRVLVVVGSMLIVTGCGTSVPDFTTNRIYLRFQENTAGEDGEVNAQQVTDIASAVTALFGTPDEPYFVTDSSLGVEQVLDVDSLASAAGPILKDNYGKGQGLYRQHCVHCHGISGDGMGPTSQFLNPYPRDFRKGVFKFKSTKKGKSRRTKI